jgi:pSer/pThr/pTyr-binding forkhead associated (FHA) protein
VNEILINGKLVTLSKRLVRIGRQLKNDVVIDDPKASRFACAIYTNDDGKSVITDGDIDTGTPSKSGLCINGEKLNPAHGRILENGDTVWLSPNTSFKFFSKDAREAGNPDDTIL